MEKYIQADKEELAMFTRKFKKAKEKNSGKPRNSYREQLTGCFKCEQKQNQYRNSNKKQFTGCFKCDKHDHIVKNCPLLKKKQEQGQFQKQGKK